MSLASVLYILAIKHKCFPLFVALGLQSDNALNTYKAESSHWIKESILKETSNKVTQREKLPGGNK